MYKELRLPASPASHPVVAYCYASPTVKLGKCAPRPFLDDTSSR
jgi:hypothetical protein